MKKIHTYIKNIISLVILYLCSTTIIFGQNEVEQNKNKVGQQKKYNQMRYTVESGDTVYTDYINTLYVFDRPEKRKKDKNWRKYYKTVYNFEKVYKYALMAKSLINEANNAIATGNMKPREKEKYLKNFEKELFKKFEDPLRGLTFSQGRLLLRLIEREIGLSSYYIIKNYRGGMAAGFWQGIAKIFGSNLRKPYDKFGEDKLIEELVLMYHNGSFHYLYASIYG